MLIVCSHLCKITQFYSINCNFDIVNFQISLKKKMQKKLQYLWNSLRPVSTKFNVTKHVSEVHCCWKFKIRRLLTAAIVKIERLQYLLMMQNGFLKRIGSLLSWIFKITFLTGKALERHVLHHDVQFCGGWSYCRRDAEISQFLLLF